MSCGWLASSFVVVLMGLGGCGGSTEPGPAANPNGTAPAGTVSCTITQTFMFGSTTSESTFCTEISGASMDQVAAEQRTCNGQTVSLTDGGSGAQVKQVYSGGPCPRENALGSCGVASGSFTQTSWYYTGGVLSATEVQRICSQTGGTWSPAS